MTSSIASLIDRARGLLQQGNLDDAAHLCRQALERDPTSSSAHAHLGMALQVGGRFHEAIASYDRSLALEPKQPTTLNNRGVAVRALNRLDEAVANFEAALSVQPDFTDALNNLAETLAFLGRHEEAIACFDAVLSRQPEAAMTLNSLGNSFLALKRLPEALGCYDRAIAARPVLKEAHCNRGNVLFTLKRHDEALAEFDLALAEDPAYVDALRLRGHAHFALGHFAEAAKSYLAAHSIDENAKYVLGDAWYAQAHLCEWTGLERIVAAISEGVADGRSVSVPFVITATSNDPKLLLAGTTAYSRAHHPATPLPPLRRRRQNEGRIRIGYVSANFYDHAVARLIAELFELHDRRRFEVVGISIGPDIPSDMQARLRRSFDSFIDVRAMADAEAAAAMQDLDIDIGVDLMGYTNGGRLGIFAHRPAPIQVNFLGYPGTSGAEYIDYIIADPFIVPAGSEASYSERVVRLPDTYQPNDRKRRIAERLLSRIDVGLPSDGLVFCCFNNNFKINPAMFDVWMRLLRRVEGSVLWLLIGDPAVAVNLGREAQARGVNPARIVFAPKISMDQHLARQRVADLFLDTAPYNAHTTASDALWSGLPVLTCAGNTFAARVAGSLLHAVGLPELVTTNLDAYEAKALELARNPEQLGELRKRLQRNRTSAPLFDPDRYRRHIEAAYVTMWEIHGRGDEPRTIDVTPLRS